MENQTMKEVRYLVGEAWKGAYDGATPYGLANVVQDPTGLSVYRSLKSGNIGHPLTDTTWWFKIIDLSGIKTESDRIAALNTALERDEALRVAAEQARVLAENGRVDAEALRVQAESSRNSAEQGRSYNEGIRQNKEAERQGAEASRAEAESTRQTKETQRQAAETLRDQSESARATAENNRAAAETQRHQQYSADHALSEELNTHQPRINTTTGCWEYWDPVNDEYVDSGVMAMASPYATFDIDPTTGQLQVETAATYAGPTFSLDTENGNLEITI